MLKRLALLILATVCSGCIAAQDMSGTWKLNANKSDWHNVRRPVSVIVTVEHREPMLKFSGWVTYSDDSPRGFDFDGAIDGSPYPAIRSFGRGASRFCRLTPRIIPSNFRSEDGRFHEEARTMLSADGKQMTRRLHVNGPKGREDWTEVYEKQR